MTIRTNFKRGAAGLAVMAILAGAAVIPTAASAQTYGQPGGAYNNGGYAYDACQRERTGRGTGGALLGAGIGAVAGSHVAARGNRTEGAVLGGLLGALIGGNVGAKSAACTPGTTQQGYGQPAPGAQAEGGYYGYEGGEQGYQQGAYGQDYQGYDQGGYAPRPVADAPGADDCTLAESPIYLPDGTVQKRYVRVCRDSTGHYQVVD